MGKNHYRGDVQSNSASQRRKIFHGILAGQPVNQKSVASQEKEASQLRLASHEAVDNQKKRASQKEIALQKAESGQKYREIQKVIASQRLEASQERVASHRSTGTQDSGARAKARALRKCRRLVSIFYDVQDVRKRSFSRLRTVGKVEGVDPKLLKKLELQIRNAIGKEIVNVPVHDEFLGKIKGVGPVLSAGLISTFDVRKADHPSSFWRYAGLHVVNGRAVRRTRGVKIDFHPKARTLAWKISDCFIKHQTPFYIDIYYKAKEEEAKKLNRPDIDPRNCPHYDECQKRLVERARRLGRDVKKLPCALHIDLRARRKMVKRFLADFWIAWRQLEGLPVGEPYAVGVLGHEKIKCPYLP